MEAVAEMKELRIEEAHNEELHVDTVGSLEDRNIVTDRPSVVT
jgi:hypothetical protein